MQAAYKAADAGPSLQGMDISQPEPALCCGGFISAAIVLIAGPHARQDVVPQTGRMGHPMVGGGAILCSSQTHSPLWFTVLFTLDHR